MSLLRSRRREEPAAPEQAVAAGSFSGSGSGSVAAGARSSATRGGSRRLSAESLDGEIVIDRRKDAYSERWSTVDIIKARPRQFSSAFVRACLASAQGLCQRCQLI